MALVLVFADLIRDVVCFDLLYIERLLMIGVDVFDYPLLGLACSNLDTYGRLLFTRRVCGQLYVG